MRMRMQRGVSNASSHSDEFAWNCEKKTARKKTICVSTIYGINMTSVVNAKLSIN